MLNINNVIMSGNLVSDPTISKTNNQTPVVNFRIANSRNIGDKTKTCFVDCASFGKTAELVMQYCSKGSAVVVEGQLEEDQWTADDGAKRFKHYITAWKVHFVSEKSHDSESEPPKYRI